MNLLISIMHASLLEGPWKQLIGKKNEPASPWKEWDINRKLVGMTDWKGSSYLKSKYTISGCRFLFNEGSYLWVLTVLHNSIMHNEEKVTWNKRNENILKS